MDCNEAFHQIVADFKDLLGDRELEARRAEEAQARGIREEANVVRRLEHQMEVLRRDLVALKAQNNAAVPYMCSSCSRPLVHDQFSREVQKHVGEKKKGANRTRKSSGERVAFTDEVRHEIEVHADASDHPGGSRDGFVQQTAQGSSDYAGQNFESNMFGDSPLPPYQPPLQQQQQDYPSLAASQNERPTSQASSTFRRESPYRDDGGARNKEMIG